MLQPRTSLLRFSAVFVLFASQCSIVRGRALLSRSRSELQGSIESVKELPSSSNRQIVSDGDAERWLEQALWGPDGAKQWRHHSLLGTHRLRINGIEEIHMLPKLKTHHNRTHLTHGDGAASGEDKEGSNDDDDDDEETGDTSDDQEDVLSAGLRSTAMARQRALQERRAKETERKSKARISREEVLKNLLSHESVKQREARRVREAAHARARQRSAKATSDVNVMLQQVMEELDLERHRCDTYFKTAEIEKEVAQAASAEDQEQVARMESKLHASEGDLRDIEHQLTQLSEGLRAHKARCESDLVDLRSKSAALVVDANTTQKLMSLSPCPKGAAAVLLQCQHPVTGKPYITSRHQGLHEIMAQLTSHTARHALQRSLKTIARSSRHKKHHIVYTSFLQRVSRHHRSRSHRHGHTVHQSSKSKCHTTAADCKAVESALILMMADVYDKQHTTMVAIDRTVRECDTETGDLERETAHLLRRREMISLHLTQTLSAKGILQSEASGRLQDYDRFNQGLADVRKECDGSVKSYEGQVCDLKRSRKSIYDTNGVTVSAAELTDCEVSPWSPAEACSEECGGGVQRSIRTIINPAGAKGMPCPALETSRPCNLQPCPIDCKVTDWAPWSECSAICGGGIRQRFRQTKVQAQNGAQCLYALDQFDSCNEHPCEPDCKLGGYSEWSGCSRACNGGYNQRTRAIAVPKHDTALCPTEEQRSEYRKCDLLKCPAVAVGQTLQCSGKVDVTFVLDGSSSVGDQDFEFSKQFVSSIIAAIRLGNAGRAGVILVGGPTSWTAFEECKLEGSSSGALEKCNVALKQSLSADNTAVTQAVNNLVKAGGPAYLSGALTLAEQEVERTRDDAAGIVLVIGHARPLSEARTDELAKRVRDKARVMWMVVGGSETNKDPTTGSRVLSAQQVGWWASTPTSDNVFEAKDYTELNLPAKLSEVISAICPSVVGLAYVASHPLPCTEQGGTVIASEAACKEAASKIGSCTSFGTGSFPNQPACFSNVDGALKGKCQWNTNTAATVFMDGTLPICIAP